MVFRWFESAAVALATVAAVTSCSSDDANEMEGVGGSAASSGSGGSSVAAAGGGAGAGGTAAGAMGGTGNAAPPGFAADVWPILTANCASISCHGDGSFLPQHAHSNVDTAYEEAKPVANLMAGRVSGQLTPIMPQFCGPAPGFGECLSLPEVQLIQAWAEAGAPY